MGFFDAYTRFREAGTVRLNARYEALIDRHRTWITGKRVLDVGSHDGRWAFAALSCGATHVVGIEPRPELVAAAEDNLLAYGVSPSRFSFYIGSVEQVMRNAELQVETALVFGVLYHLHDHVGLFQMLRGSGADTLIIDTALSPDHSEAKWYSRTVALLTEPVDNVMNAASELFPGSGKAIVSHPSRAAVRFLAEQFEFVSTEVDWPPFLETWGTDGLSDYAEDKRTTFVLHRP